MTEEALRYFTNWLRINGFRFSVGRHVCGSSNPLAEVKGTSCGALDLELEAEKEVAHESHFARPPTGAKSVSTGSDPVAALSLTSAGLCLISLTPSELFVIIGLTNSSRAAWQEEDTRKDFRIVLIFQEQLTMFLFRTDSSSTIIMSNVQSIYISSSI